MQERFQMSFEIDATHRFKKEIKAFAKKYKKIKVDYKNLLDSWAKSHTWYKFRKQLL